MFLSSPPVEWLSWACVAVLLLFCWIYGHDAIQDFRRHPRLSLHLTCAVTLGLALLWSLSLETGLGFHLHFTGIAFAVLLLGPELAYFACLIAASCVLMLKQFDPWILPLSLIFGGLLPVLMMHWLVLTERKKQSHNFFVFIMVNGFLGGMLVVSLIVILGVGVAQFLDPDTLNGDALLMLQYIPLIALPEGILNGMLVTGFLVFKPEWVRTLDENRYEHPVKK
ncbi:MAG: energy-coupling factor ABC transporter permease [Hahellaceae bacterium]|jgi:uncharacterized membrane protein|nr:energy-coupling factor ABC transporter permease [Hahellaceae bacterium]